MSRKRNVVGFKKIPLHSTKNEPEKNASKNELEDKLKLLNAYLIEKLSKNKEETIPADILTKSKQILDVYHRNEHKLFNRIISLINWMKNFIVKHLYKIGILLFIIGVFF